MCPAWGPAAKLGRDAMTSHPLSLGRDASATRPSVSRYGRLSEPSVRPESCAPPASFYSQFGQRRVGDNPPYQRQNLRPSCPQVLSSSFTPHVPLSPCPRAPSKAPPSLGRDGCPQPSVRGQTHAPRSSSCPLSGQRRVGDNPPYLQTAAKTMNQEQRTRLALPPYLPSCPQVLSSSFTPHVPLSPCPRAPSKAPPSLGRDGCPQPSVRGQTHAPRSSSCPLSGQRRVEDNPPYPRQLTRLSRS